MRGRPTASRRAIPAIALGFRPPGPQLRPFRAPPPPTRPPPTRRRHYRVPPGVRRGLAASRLPGADEPRSHVRDPIDLLGAERVPLRVLRVPEDVVVLRRPALLRARAVVVGPDDLVHERRATEDLVEEHLAVVHLAVVDVEEE